jgi:hypothetical protein
VIISPREATEDTGAALGVSGCRTPGSSGSFSVGLLDRITGVSKRERSAVLRRVKPLSSFPPALFHLANSVQLL